MASREKRSGIIGRTTLRDLVETNPGSSIRAGSILGHIVPQLGLPGAAVGRQTLVHQPRLLTQRVWLRPNRSAKLQNCLKQPVCADVDSCWRFEKKRLCSRWPR